MTPFKIIFDKDKCTLLLGLNQDDLEIPDFLSSRAKELNLIKKTMEETSASIHLTTKHK